MFGIDRKKKPETYIGMDGIERHDDLFKYIVEDGAMRFGPFDSAQDALDWAARRAQIADECALIPSGLNVRISALRFPGRQ